MTRWFKIDMNLNACIFCYWLRLTEKLYGCLLCSYFYSRRMRSCVLLVPRSKPNNKSYFMLSHVFHSHSACIFASLFLLCVIAAYFIAFCFSVHATFLFSFCFLFTYISFSCISFRLYTSLHLFRFWMLESFLFIILFGFSCFETQVSEVRWTQSWLTDWSYLQRYYGLVGRWSEVEGDVIFYELNLQQLSYVSRFMLPSLGFSSFTSWCLFVHYTRSFLEFQLTLLFNINGRANGIWEYMIFILTRCEN